MLVSIIVNTSKKGNLANYSSILTISLLSYKCTSDLSTMTTMTDM